MALEDDLKIVAIKNAINIYEMIVQSFNDPTKMVIGEASKIYEDFLKWQFIDKYPILEEKNKWLYINMIAMQQYKHLKWQKDHPVKKNEKRSKWEVVHGKVMSSINKNKQDIKKKK